MSRLKGNAVRGAISLKMCAQDVKAKTYVMSEFSRIKLQDIRVFMSLNTCLKSN